MHSRSFGGLASARSPHDQLSLIRRDELAENAKTRVRNTAHTASCTGFRAVQLIRTSRALPKFSVLSLCPESRPLERKLIDQGRKRVRMAPIFASLGMLWGHSAQQLTAQRRGYTAPASSQACFSSLRRNRKVFSRPLCSDLWPVTESFPYVRCCRARPKSGGN